MTVHSDVIQSRAGGRAACRSSLETASAADNEPVPELRQLIRDAGMIPWRGHPISLEESLRQGSTGEKIQLRQYVTGEAPLLVYMYSYW